MRKATRRRRGAVIVLIAVLLIPIMGIVALALDGGVLQQDRRIAQAVADAAALAAADSLFANYQTGQGFDVNGAATNKALAIASANGYTNDGVQSKVTVNIPPASGLHQDQPGYAEVLVEYYQPRFFSNLWGSDQLTIRARAVAIGQWAPFRNGITVLDPASSGALNNNGSGTVNIINADVVVDSSAPDAATTAGGGTISAPNFYISGNPGTGTSTGGNFIGNIVPNQQPIPDPLAYVPVPDPSDMNVRAYNPTNLSDNVVTLIRPGVYKGGINVSGQATLIMLPGIYYMDGGGFSYTSQGDLAADGVMIYSSPSSSSDVININGSGQVNFTPPWNGVYQGMALWQDRGSTNTISITGNGSSALYGTIYTQHGTLTVSGNGTGNGNGNTDVLGSQYVSYDLNLGGNGNFNLMWGQDITGRTRYIYLVE
jgi:hypothetical protein